MNALLANELVQDALLTIGPEPPPSGGGRWKQKVDASGHAVRWHTTRTKRAQRIFRIQLALRGLLTGSEIDHYASVIAERRSSEIWRKGHPPPVLSGAAVDRLATAAANHENRGPNSNTVKLAVDTLAYCVAQCRQGEPEGLNKHDQRRLSQVLRYFGLDPNSHLRRETVEGAKKRRQRQARAMGPIVQVERERLDARVAEGTLYRWTHADFERLTDELGLEVIGDPEFAVYTEPPGPWSEAGGDAPAIGRGISTGTVHAVDRMNGHARESRRAS